MSPSDSKDEREILFEFRTLGNQVRVAAIDADSGTEVIIVAPVSASQAEMQRIATAKLMRQLAKQADR